MGIKTTVFEEIARGLLTDSLVAAKGRGETILQGHCSFCSGNCRSGGSVCLICALLLHRSMRPDEVAASKIGLERTAAKILALPERWVIDLVTGFDDDGGDVTYRSAKSIGRQLWRKHGEA